ncbi:MAG: hypothetical protein WDW36_001291 [Sanguina aurantia]
MMAKKQVVFRSISGPLSNLQPTQQQETSSSSSRDVLTSVTHTDFISSIDERPSSPKSRSFTFGCPDKEESRRVSVDEQDFEHPLLEVADGTGTSPELLEAVANAMVSNVERFELLEQMIATVQVGGLQSNPSDPTGRHQPRVSSPTIFHGMRPPPITIPAYLERIAKYSRCSPVCFVMATSYIDRLVERYADFTPTSLSIHRLLLTSVMLAAKLTDDHYFNNAFYSRVGGVSIQELNRMEVSMLQLLDYKLVLTVDATRHYLKLLLGGAMVLGSGEGSASSMSAARKRRSGNGSMCERRQSRRSSASSGGGGLSSGPHSSGYQDPDDQDEEDAGREAGGDNEEVASGEQRAEVAAHRRQQRAEHGVDGQGGGVNRGGQVEASNRLRSTSDTTPRKRLCSTQERSCYSGTSSSSNNSILRRHLQPTPDSDTAWARRWTTLTLTLTTTTTSTTTLATAHAPDPAPTKLPTLTSPPSVPRSTAAVTFAGTFRDDEDNAMSGSFLSRRSQSHAGNQQQPSPPQQQRSHSERLPRCRAHAGRDAAAQDARGVGGQDREGEEFAGGLRRQRLSWTSPAPAGLHRQRTTGSDMQQ